MYFHIIDNQITRSLFPIYNRTLLLIKITITNKILSWLLKYKYNTILLFWDRVGHYLTRVLLNDVY